MKFNPFGLVIMLGASILIILGAIALSPRCKYAVGTVEVHVAIGGVLIAGCPNGDEIQRGMIKPAMLIRLPHTNVEAY